MVRVDFERRAHALVKASWETLLPCASCLRAALSALGVLGVVHVLLVVAALRSADDLEVQHLRTVGFWYR